MLNNLTVIVLTHNDESRIVDCLENLTFADELIVIDDNSTDHTKELVLRFTKNVFVHSLNANFANQRNFALDKANNEWVLFVDSDEIVSKTLREEILTAVKTKLNGFYIKRIDLMWGQKMLHGEAGEVRLLRLGRRSTGKWHGKVHETWEIVGQSADLEAALVHLPHPSVREFISDVDEYSSIRASDLHDRGVKATLFQIITFPIGKFFVGYVLKQGFKDGIPGLLYAIIMSFHSFLVRGKLYQMK